MATSIYQNQSHPVLLQGPAKIKRITTILDYLYSKDPINADQRLQYISELKLYGRSSQDSQPLFAKQSLYHLLDLAFEDDYKTLLTSEALAIVANAMLLVDDKAALLFGNVKEEVSQYSDVHGKLLQLIKNNDSKDSKDWIKDVAACRILFLLTVIPLPSSAVDWPSMIQGANGFANCLAQKLVKYATWLQSVPQDRDAGQQQQIYTITTELAKLISNLAHFNPEQRSDFDPCIQPLFAILGMCPPNTQLDLAFKTIVSALVYLNESSTVWTSAAYPTNAPTLPTFHFISCIQPTVLPEPTDRWDAVFAPLISLLHKLFMSSGCPPTVREAMCKQLLPSDEDRKDALGKSDSLASLLIRSTMAISALNTANSASLLLWHLCDTNDEKLITMLGYGTASGLLVKLRGGNKDGDDNLSGLIPAPAILTPGAADAICPAVNPITGQRLDQQIESELMAMTDEEKEREAERLFVLFERLNATGVIKTVNPMRDALEQGKLEDKN